MQSPKPILKIAVVLIFILLISGFVAYRSGAFDQFFTTNTPSGAFADNSLVTDPPGNLRVIDSPPRGRTIMPGSKSIVISDSRLYTLIDSLYQAKRPITNRIKRPEDKAFPADTTLLLQTDSLSKALFTDSILKKREELMMMSGSKSGLMIQPADIKQKKTRAVPAPVSPKADTTKKNNNP